MKVVAPPVVLLPTYVHVECGRGLVCGGVADENGFEAIGEVQASVDPLVLWRFDDVAHNPLHGRVRHGEGLGRQKAAVREKRKEGRKEGEGQLDPLIQS